ncbi:MAG: molybdate ABC transporter permease subunit [Chloroflexi bacterium]|nr:molybdate ABC transporter permease subunit [Chloroflexota bacterium]
METAASQAPTKARWLRPFSTARLNLVWVSALALALVLFLVVPLGAVIYRAASSGAVAGYIGRPVVVEALRLSLVTSAIAVALTIILGTPAAYLLARHRFPGHALLDTALDMPMVLPPAVAGVALLMTFGRRGILGAQLEALGLHVAFSTAAVVMAQLFVAAPFYVKAAKGGFEAVPPDLESVSATLGASGLRTFLRVTVPLALPALLSGAVMSWARALGEFGATIMFAGNFQGRTQTMPLAIYQAMQSDFRAALVLSLFLTVTSFVVLVAFKALARRTTIGSYYA